MPKYYEARERERIAASLMLVVNFRPNEPVRSFVDGPKNSTSLRRNVISVLLKSTVKESCLFVQLRTVLKDLAIEFSTIYSVCVGFHVIQY